MPTRRALPPLDRCFGTRPSQAANWRPFLKRVLSPTAPINAVSFDLAEALAGLAIAEDFAYPAIVGCNSPIQFSQFLPQLPHQGTDQFAEIVIAACDEFGKAAS